MYLYEEWEQNTITFFIVATTYWIIFFNPIKDCKIWIFDIAESVLGNFESLGFVVICGFYFLFLAWENLL